MIYPLNYDNTGVTVELGDIVASGVNVWDFDYPVPTPQVTYNGKTAKVPFDKKTFEQKILDHYRFRQIGQETVGRWLHYFRTRIREIMPYYVQLYEFEAKWWNIQDPLESYNLTETFEQESTGTGNTSGTNSSETSETGTTSGSNSSEREETKNRTEATDAIDKTDKTVKFSDTPQGGLTNVVAGYLTNVTMEEGNDTKTQDVTENATGSETLSGTSEQTSTDTGTASGTFSQNSENAGTVTHTLTRRGNIGVQPLGTEVKNIRDAFINIDLMVINELKDLFIQVY